MERIHIRSMANLLRIRLQFKNCRPRVVGDCWFLLDPRVYRQVNDFMKDIQAKFQLGPFPLRCSTKGFLLPPNEDIAIIRDEDVIVIEEEGRKDAIIVQEDSLGELNEVVQNFNKGQENFAVHSHAGDGSRQKRKLEEGNIVIVKSKKRKKGASTKEIDSMIVGPISGNMDDSAEPPKTKTLTKKNKSKTRELEEVGQASKDKIEITAKQVKQRDDILNYGKSLMKVVKMADKKQKDTKGGRWKKEMLDTNGSVALKSLIQRKEIAENGEKEDALNEEVPGAKCQKQKGKKKISKDTSNSAIKNKSTKENDKIEDLKSKSEVIKDERPFIDPITSEKIIPKRGNTLTTAKGNFQNYEVNKMNEGNSRAIGLKVNPEQKKNATLDEKSFQIMERKEASSNQTSTPLTSSNFLHPKKMKNVLSKNNGSHIYFGSDDDDDDGDDDKTSDTVSSANSHKIKDSNSDFNNAEYSDKSAKKKALKDRLVNVSRIYVNSADSPKVNENNKNLGKNAKEDVTSQNENDINMKDMQSENSLLTPKHATSAFVASSSVNESNSQGDTTINHNKTKVVKDYSKYPSLQGAPRIGDKIAFKILELSLSYTPEVSDYKEALIQDIEQSTGVTQLLLSEDSRKRITGDGDPISRRFELEEDEEDERQFESIIEMNWKELVEPKLL